jgi:hypothetical protein
MLLPSRNSLSLAFLELLPLDAVVLPSLFEDYLLTRRLSIHFIHVINSNNVQAKHIHYP